MQLCLCTDFNGWFEHVCKKTDQWNILDLNASCFIYTENWTKKRKKNISVCENSMSGCLISISYFTHYIQPAKGLYTLDWFFILLSLSFNSFDNFDTFDWYCMHIIVYVMVYEQCHLLVELLKCTAKGSCLTAHLTRAQINVIHWCYKHQLKPTLI